MRKEYSKDFLTKVIHDHYGLGSITGEPKIFSTGYENTNYYVPSSTGEYVVKVFEGEDVSHDTVKFESEVMRLAAEKGVKTPTVLRNTDGETCELVDGKSVVVMPYVIGTNMDDTLLSKDLIFQIGEEIAKLSNALAELQDQSYVRKEHEYDQKHLLLQEDALEHLLDYYNVDLIRDVINEFRAEKERFDSLPTGLIHNDAVPHNILADGNTLHAVIDFGDMNFSPYVQDVAVSLGSIAQNSENKKFCPEQTASFIKGYQVHRNLSDEELDMLYLLIQCRLVLVILGFSRHMADYGEDAGMRKFIDNYHHFLQELRSYGKQEFDRLLK